VETGLNGRGTKAIIPRLLFIPATENNGSTERVLAFGVRYILVFAEKTFITASAIFYRLNTISGAYSTASKQ